MRNSGWGPEDAGRAFRTLCEFNLPALAWPHPLPDADGWISAWAQAFDVEKVTKRFYEDYATVFESVERAIARGNKLSEEELRLFTQTLFNRLMFLRFIERKGWLEFDGRHDYLRALFAAPPIGGQSFYVGRLQPLFFKGLAIEGEQASPAIGRVPFLNGGLFEATDLDGKVKDIPDSAFERILQADGLFYRYNFTVEESTPLDIEVAVDPEMLGKVFEELVTGRHESGSYYTPRPIVSFMCREALKGFLAERTKATAAAVAALVDARDASKLKETHAREVLAALDDLKAVDPACGSGAYLLGLMQEIIGLYRLLYSERLIKDARSLYELKLRIISQNLYGVDIDRFATNIAMLRLWLSLAVDGDAPNALPNLDFRVEIGDSLAGPDPRETQDVFKVRVQAQANALVNAKRQYLEAHGREKLEYRRLVASTESALKNELTNRYGSGVIVWSIQFAEVFVDGSRGFDIILANPPYGIDTGGQYSDTSGTRDSYGCFLALANSLCGRSGACVFIVPTSWETGERFLKFRRWLFGNNRVEAVVNLPYDVFEIPFVDTAIVCYFPNRRQQGPEAIRVATLPKRAECDLTKIEESLEPLPTEKIASDPSLRLVLRPTATQILEAVANCPRLGDVARIKRGIEAYQYTILNAARGSGWQPYFDGAVDRYIVRPGSGEAYVKPKEVDVNWHRGPRIVIRRLVSRANRLMAARMEFDAVVKKDLYVLRLGPDAVEDHLLYLLGLVNSSVISYLYLCRSAAAQKDDFRQVSLAGLRDLPVPIAFPRKADLIAHVRRMETLRPDDASRAGIDAEIDSLVFDAFGIDKSGRDEVASFLALRG